MNIRLEWNELMQAALAGTMRHVAALKQGKKDTCGLLVENGWSVHIEGACGEFAVAKALNMFSGLGVNTFKLPDIGNLQVRTRSKHEYELIVRPGDADDDFFVLVTGVNGQYIVRGGIHGRDAKKPAWIRTHGNRPAAYFVPHVALVPIGRIERPTSPLRGECSASRT